MPKDLATQCYLRNAKYYTVLAILIAAGLTIFPDSGHAPIWQPLLY